MQLTDRVFLVGSGSMGFGLTNDWDCHVFLVDGGSELALVDVGAGMGTDAIVANVRAAGRDPDKITTIVLTHGHGDHAGGAAAMSERLPGARLAASPQVASWLSSGDEQGTSIDVAKAAGIYPEEYVLRPARVDRRLSDGEQVAVGDVALEVLATPGHADGHVSLLVAHGGRRILFSGDAVFFGGRILLQNLHDCRLDAHVRSLRRLRELEIDSLLPSHLALSLNDGQRHIEQANEALDRLLLPGQLVPA